MKLLQENGWFMSGSNYHGFSGSAFSSRPPKYSIQIPDADHIKSYQYRGRAVWRSSDSMGLTTGPCHNGILPWLWRDLLGVHRSTDVQQREFESQWAPAANVAGGYEKPSNSPVGGGGTAMTTYSCCLSVFPPCSAVVSASRSNGVQLFLPSLSRSGPGPWPFDIREF